MSHPDTSNTPWIARGMAWCCASGSSAHAAKKRVAARMSPTPRRGEGDRRTAPSPDTAGGRHPCGYESPLLHFFVGVAPKRTPRPGNGEKQSLGRTGYGKMRGEKNVMGIRYGLMHHKKEKRGACHEEIYPDRGEGNCFLSHYCRCGVVWYGYVACLQGGLMSMWLFK